MKIVNSIVFPDENLETLSLSGINQADKNQDFLTNKCWYKRKLGNSYQKNSYFPWKL